VILPLSVCGFAETLRDCLTFAERAFYFLTIGFNSEDIDALQ
jgi:hypothetical protein